MQKEILNEFRINFQTQYSDLSKINKKDFEKALDLFIETKFILVENKVEEKDYNNKNNKTKVLEKKYIEYDSDSDYDYDFVIFILFFKCLELSICCFFKGMLFFFNYLFK